MFVVKQLKSWKKSIIFFKFVKMKDAAKHNTSKATKGERLRWSAITKDTAVPLTRNMVQSRTVSSPEKDTKGSKDADKNSFLVP